MKQQANLIDMLYKVSDKGHDSRQPKACVAPGGLKPWPPMFMCLKVI